MRWQSAFLIEAGNWYLFHVSSGCIYNYSSMDNSDNKVNMLQCKSANVFVRDDLDFEKIARSGQCFRWESLPDGSYKVIFGNNCVYAEDLGEGRFQFSCTDAEFYETWYDYLDLGTDYSEIRSMVDPEADPFLWRASECQKGIRILRQDPWETLVSFIISQNKNIPAIRRSIEALCSVAGEQLTDARGFPYFGFPNPGAVASLSQDQLLQCGLGYRWKYVSAAANAVLECEIDLEQLKHADEKTALDALTGLYGVGVKVASCVALFGLHHTDAFPIDVWMKRVLENEYPHGYPFEAYRPYNGVFQQYMFAHYRSGS